MERHPSENYIKFLMSLPRDEAKDNDWVCMAVQAIGYPLPDVEYLDRLRHGLLTDKPAGYDPTDRYHRPTTKFLRKHEIWTFHHTNSSVMEAWEILHNFEVRRVTEQLLLGRLGAKETTKKINSRVGGHYKADSVAVYGHYFWNCAVMKVQDWATFFTLYDSEMSSRAMSVLNGGPAMALHVTGFAQNLESKHMLQEIQETLYFDFKDWEKRPRSKDKTRALTSIAKAATQVDVRLSEADAKLKDSLEAFKQFRMQHAQSKVKSLEEVAGPAAFSNSGVPLKELKAPEEEPNSSEEELEKEPVHESRNDV